jgi:hypothetical protein
MNSINRRVSKLEGATGAGKPPHHVVTIMGKVGEREISDSETDDEIIARYRVEHPDTPGYTKFIIIRFVEPKHPGEAPGWCSTSVHLAC